MYSLQEAQPTYTYWSHEPEMWDLWSVVVATSSDTLYVL